MKTNIVSVLAFICSLNLQAYSNFIENPYTPYPPGCATLPLWQGFYGDYTKEFFVGKIELLDATRQGYSQTVNVRAFRVGCPEENRSVVMLEFTLPDDKDPASTYYGIPEVSAQYDKGLLRRSDSMRLSAEPNHWGSIEPAGDMQVFGAETRNTAEGYKRRWVFILDNRTPRLSAPDESYMSPADYNQAFTLNFASTLHPVIIEVPSTASLFEGSWRIPLSGRLSGNWVVEGASDQGFVIAISELVPDAAPTSNELWDSPLVMFLSWYTYDVNGDLLWLTGAAQFAMGDTEVTIPIEDVSNGEFMGDKTADRKAVGSVTITGNNCNDLTLQYNLSDIGLGSGTKHLERLFSLETAGYVCRDLEARMATK